MCRLDTNESRSDRDRRDFPLATVDLPEFPCQNDNPKWCRWRLCTVDGDVISQLRFPTRECVAECSGAFAGEASRNCLCEEYRDCLTVVAAAHYQSQRAGSRIGVYSLRTGSRCSIYDG